MKSFVTKRIAILSLCLGLLLGPSACDFYNDNMGMGRCPDVAPYFRILEIHPLNTILRTNSIGHNYLEEISGFYKSVIWTNYYLWINYEREFYSQHVGFGSSAFALSCISTGELGAKEGLKSLQITALKDYNEQIKAGDSVLPIMHVLYYDGLLSQIDNIMEAMQRGINGSMAFQLLEGPDESIDEMQFRVRMELDNGQVFEQLTAPFDLLKN
jgi:hypothetical protein